MQVTEWVRVVFAHRNLLGTLASIREAKKTGSLTVHFGQGGIVSIEWQQKQVQLGTWPFQVSRETCTPLEEGIHGENTPTPVTKQLNQ